MESLLTYQLHHYQKDVDAGIELLEREQILPRIWKHDHTVWNPKPVEITNRLGWLRAVDADQEMLNQIERLLLWVKHENYTRALLLGMGGSSLAPEVFRKVFGVKPGYTNLAILESTDPGAVIRFVNGLDGNVEKTIIIISTKSGSTVETLSMFKYFYQRVVDEIGHDQAGKHFIAITDPGSPLAELAKSCDFWMTFLNDPHIGGRYSALSYFGMVPAALGGVNVVRLLTQARAMAKICGSQSDVPPNKNAAAILGVILAEMAKAGRDKLTLVISPIIESLGDWIEQLIAESLGKEGKGILPVVGEVLGGPESYRDDRLFVNICLGNDDPYRKRLEILQSSGHPVVNLKMEDVYDVGGHMFLWELASAVAGYGLAVNPFDQPNVESAKVLACKMLEANRETGVLPQPTPLIDTAGFLVFSDSDANSLEDALRRFLTRAQPGAYVALQAYLPPFPDIHAALHELRDKIHHHTRFATTLGYRPRFLHSTGQLHKGDAGLGLFIQLTATPEYGLPIPDRVGEPASSISFAMLELAQALGDHQALIDAGRPVMCIHIKSNVQNSIRQLAQAI